MVSVNHGVELRTPLVDAHLLQQLQQMQPLRAAFTQFPDKSLLAGAPVRGLSTEPALLPRTPEFA